MAKNITCAELRSVLNYDPETGIFTRDGVIAGSICGPYRSMVIHQRRYRSHRLAWLYMTGDWPPHCIDHINGDPLDNRWANLRSATISQNQQNRRVSKASRVGLKGVSHHCTGGFRASIRLNGKQKSLGYFKCPAAAHFAYVIAAENNFGEFARAA